MKENKEIVLLRTDEDFKDWVTLYPKFSNAHLTFDKWGYDDWDRPMLHIQISHVIALVLSLTLSSWFALLFIPMLFIGWGDLYIYLPFQWRKRSEFAEESPRWGYYFYTEQGHHSMWFLTGKSTKALYMPYAFEWYRTAILRNDGSWEVEMRGDRKDFYDEKWKGVLYEETYPYKYTLKDGTIQEVNATIQVKTMEWRRRWLMGFPLFNLIRKSIDVNFSEEVGEGVHSWKGGTIGCSYNMLPGETALQCLKRMEKERKF